MGVHSFLPVNKQAEKSAGVHSVVSWLVNVAVSEMTIMRMRTCGQRGCNINPIKTPKSVCTR